MFERFTDDAREAVTAAQHEAVALRHGWIGTEHVLLGVLATGGGGARLLAGFGLDAAGVREDVVRIVGRGEDDLDPDALATLGIDLEAVRERVERAFGPGALSRRGRCRRGGVSMRLPFSAREEGARAHAARGDQPRRARPAHRAPRPRAAARGRRRRRARADRARRDARRGAREGRRPRRRVSRSSRCPTHLLTWGRCPAPSSGSAPRWSARAGASGTSRPTCCRAPTSTPSSAPAGSRCCCRPTSACTTIPTRSSTCSTGCILAGGADIDPATYGAQAHSETRGTVPERDDFEIALAAPRPGARPAAAGHLPRHAGHERRHAAARCCSTCPRATATTSTGATRAASTAPTTTCASADGSLAARAAGEVTHGTKSHHHQGVDRVGDGLRGHRLVGHRRAARGLRGARSPLRARRPVAPGGRRDAAASSPRSWPRPPPRATARADVRQRRAERRAPHRDRRAGAPTRRSRWPSSSPASPRARRPCWPRRPTRSPTR